MHPPLTIPLASIVVNDRIRTSSDDLDALMASIKRYGLLQPPIIDQNNVLLDGWRRYTACQRLGWTDLPVYYRERMTDAEYYEIELETNLQRLGFTWQETVQAVCKIHRSRQREARRTGAEWTQDMTGALLGDYSRAYVSNCLTLEAHLTEDRYREAGSITDALRMHLQSREDEALAELRRRTSLTSLLGPPGEATFIPNLSPKAPGPRPGYSPNACSVCSGTGPQAVHCPHCKGTGYEPLAGEQISLSSMLYSGDSVLSVLPSWPDACVDHIITDPPYGIDMANLQQETTNLLDATRVAATHSVEDNLAMFNVMFHDLHRVLRDGGFLVLWCDIMNWQLLYANACAAGFGVQRWPIVWHKQSLCKNQMAHVNLTKNVEFAMVCRKGKATLPKPVAGCVVAAPNDAGKASNPFAKPEAVWKFCLDCFTVPGQTILDPFAGQGSGTLTALKFCRNVLAIEKDELHFNALLEEVKQFYNKLYAPRQVNFV